MSKTICFYHSGDMDGKCSASIVKKTLPNCWLIGIDYQDIPDFDWSLIKDNIIIMVDFSLPKEDMIRIKTEASWFIWIDHHITAIEQMQDLIIDGYTSTDKAACELTWDYFFNPEPIPELITLIGNWDIWNHENPKVELFHYGLEAYDIDVDNPVWLNYNVDDICHIGKQIINYQKKLDIQTMKNAYVTHLHGLKALLVNAPHGSKKFEQHPEVNNVDILVCYIIVNKGSKIRVSLYTKKNHINVGLLAKASGGGGHKQAAGYVLDIDQLRLLTEG